MPNHNKTFDTCIVYTKPKIMRHARVITVRKKNVRMGGHAVIEPNSRNLFS
jgi:hypothetical protein